MKFTCTYENLKTALQDITSVVQRNINLPITENILISVEDGISKLSATNLEIGVIRTISSKIESEGSIVIPPQLLVGFLNAIRGGEHITIEKKDLTIVVKSGSYENTIMGLDADDFPIIPQEKETTFHRVSLPLLQESIAAVLPFATQSEIRPELTGVYITQKDQELFFVSTDSFRLGEKVVSVREFFGTTGAGIDSSLILPQKICAYILQMSDLYEEVEFSVTNNHLILKSRELYVTSRLIDGQYPDYKQIIPQSSESTIILKKEDVVEIMRVMMVFLQKNKHEITFTVEEDHVSIGTRVAEAGMSTTKIEGVIESEGISLVVNPQYVLDGLKKIKEEGVYIGINNSAAPIVVRGVGDDNINSGFTYIVMPINSK